MSWSSGLLSLFVSVCVSSQLVSNDLDLYGPETEVRIWL